MIFTELDNVIWILLCGILVLLMQAGFTCLESGLVRQKNSINVAMKNFVDFCIAGMAFWAVGYGIMFGAAGNTFIGTSDFFFNGHGQPWLLAFFFFQLTFCGTTSTLISGALSERMKFSSYVIVTLLVATIIYPVFGHWAWGGSAGEPSAGWLKEMGFIDFAGSTVVHSVGGWVALAALLVVGPRIGRFEEGGQPIQGHNLPLATLGAFLLVVGWMGFNGGSTLSVTSNIPLILVNTILASAAGGLMTLAISWYRSGYANVVHCINGALAGLVGITASADIVTISSAVVIGGVGGWMSLGATRLLETYHIDDPIGVVPVHLAGGIWGTLTVSLFGDPHGWKTGLEWWEQLSIQATGIVVCFGWAFGLAFGALYFLNRWIPIRVTAEEEWQGLNISEHQATSVLADLLTEMDFRNKTGDFSIPVKVEPHTEVGQMAIAYNRIQEKIIEDSKERETLLKNLVNTLDEHYIVLASISDIFITLNFEGCITKWNQAAEATTGVLASQALNVHLSQLPIPWDGQNILEVVAECQNLRKKAILPPLSLPQTVGISRILELTISPLFLNTDRAEVCGVLIIGRDVTEQTFLESQLGQAQKMESIGQLAAGIAHEINTPTQFVSDNLRFLTESFSDIQKVLDVYEQVINTLPPATLDAQLLDTMNSTLAEADLAYVCEEVPKALQQSLEGSERVGKIVRAMKEFSHPGTAEKKPVDLNHAIESTITVARNEWKYVAELVTEFEPTLPPVPCLPGEFNQVILNLVINAAHAIETAIRPESDGTGTITVSTHLVGEEVEIRIADTGTGIPEAAQKKIFDPFFTTKEVGKGTGQGLAIAHDVIVNKHGGRLTFETTVGTGTTFIIQLPCQQANMVGEAR